MTRRDEVLALRDRLLELAFLTPEARDPMLIDDLHALITHIRAVAPWWAVHLPQPSARETYESSAALLQTLPELPTALLQSQGREMRIRLDGVPLDAYSMRMTSGSTGEPRQVLKHTETDREFYDAATLVEWHWQRRDPSQRILALRVGAADDDLAPAGDALLYVGAAPTMFQRTSTNRTAGELLDMVESIQPKYLYAAGNVLRMLAAEQLARPRALVGLQQLLSVSDRVDSAMRAMVFEAFGARVIDRYSSEEFGYIALQCPSDDHLHVLEPLLLVEIVDEHGRACPPGVPGRVLITSLRDVAQPLIRYAIGDVAEWATACSAGITWPAIQHIHGRVRQYVRTPSGEQQLVTLVGAEFLAIPEVLDFQLLVFTDALVLLTHSVAPLSASIQGIIERSLREVFRSSLPVHVVPVDTPLWRPAEKRHEFELLDQEFDPHMATSGLLDLAVRASGQTARGADSPPRIDPSDPI